VYATFVVFLRGILEFEFDQLLQGVCAFEGYLYVSLSEEVSYHSDFGAVVSEGGPFVVVIVVGCVYLGFTLYLCSQFGYVVDGEFIVVSMVRIFCHSAILFSVESGSDIILLIM
jgi:hypothetical protein